MGSMTALPGKDELRELLALGTPTLFHANRESGALDPAIKPLDRTRGVAGPAFTVEAVAGDNLALHVAVARAPAGSVLVVDFKACVDVAAAGDLLALAASVRGVVGMVVDGAVRDAAAIVEMGFSTFARATAIPGPTKKSAGAVGVPISCGGVRVAPGDLVVGDADGVVAIPAGRFREVLAGARARAEMEREVRAGIRAGKTTLELLGLDDPAP